MDVGYYLCHRISQYSYFSSLLSSLIETERIGNCQIIHPPVLQRGGLDLQKSLDLDVVVVGAVVVHAADADRCS